MVAEPPKFNSIILSSTLRFVVLIVVVVPFTVKSPLITKLPLTVSPDTLTYRESREAVTWSEPLTNPLGKVGAIAVTPLIKCWEPVSKVKVAAPIVEPPPKPSPAFTSVISPADASIIFWST